VGTENIFKLTIGNESLHYKSNVNGVRIVNFTTSKNLIVKRDMFPHPNLHKYNLTCPDGKTRIHIDHMLIDRRWQSSLLDVRSFRGVDCDTDHSLVFAKVRECSAVSKQTAQHFDGERFNLTKLNELEVRKENLFEISNRFVASENLNDSEDINRAWENIQENIQTSVKVGLGLTNWKQHKPWFDEECLDFLDQRKQANIQWLQDPSQSNEDNLNNVRYYVSRHCRNKKKEHPKAKNEALDTKILKNCI